MRKFKDSYLEKLAMFEQERDRLKRLIEKHARCVEKHNVSLNKLRCVSWVDEMVIPLAEELSKRLGFKNKVYGPFGLCNRTTIYLFSGNSDVVKGKPVASITIQMGDLSKGQLFYETGELKRRFAECTVGAINGMNNVVAALPESIDDIEKIIANRIKFSDGDVNK